MAAGQVVSVVVYKVDRLTRLRTDFARIIEPSDAKGVFLLSAIQQLSTSTSMSRQTLSMGLSFVQLDRELAGERIRAQIRLAGNDPRTGCARAREFAEKAENFNEINAVSCATTDDDEHCVYAMAL